MKSTLNSAAKVSVDKVLQFIPVRSSFNARTTLDLKITTLLSVLTAFRQHIEALGRPITLRPTTVYQPDYMERSKPISASVTHILDYATNSILLELRQSSRKRFGKKLDALEAAFSAVQKEITPRIIRLIRGWNASQPFHRLPVEIIAAILYMAFDGGENMEESHYKLRPSNQCSLLRTLALVSSSWASIARNTPSLWSFIDSADSPRFISTALKRSKGYPLTLSRRWASNLATEQAFLAAVNPHAHRWRSASISITWGNHPLQIPAEAAPMLEDLSLWSHTSELLNPVLPFGGVAPKLRSFKAYNASLPWNSTMMFGLQVLEVTVGSRSASVGPSITQIFTILASSPGLESFKISDIQCTEDSPQWDRSSSIDLLQLKRLHLTTVPCSFLPQLLSKVRAPSCSELHVGFRDIPTYKLETLFQAVKQSMDKVLPSARSMVSAARTVDLKIDGGDLRFDAMQHDGTLGLSIRLDNAGSVLVPWVASVHGDRNLIPRPSVISLQVSQLDFMADQELNFILESLPWINSLDLPAQTSDQSRVTAVLRYLSRPSSSERDDGAIEWPLPQLKELKLSGREWPSDVLMEMVDARYGGATRVHLDRGAVRPVSLNRLTIEEPRWIIAVSCEDNLKRVLGREVVKWVDAVDEDDYDDEIFFDDAMSVDDGSMEWGNWDTPVVPWGWTAQDNDE